MYTVPVPKVLLHQTQHWRARGQGGAFRVQPPPLSLVFRHAHIRVPPAATMGAASLLRGRYGGGHRVPGREGAAATLAQLRGRTSTGDP